MKEFNLERALAGEPVITRNGKKVTQLHLFKNDELIQPLYGMVEGDDDVFNWSTYGKYNFSKQTSFDLFMAPEKRSCWVNVYQNSKLESIQIFAGDSYPNKETAIEHIDNIYFRQFSTYIKTIEITNEV
jgi:hypothetical protein